MKQKTIRAALALIMAAVLAFISPANAFAEAKPALYIKDIMVGMGETADEAKKALTDAGFTVLDQNLNEGAGSAFKTEKFVYLGYKTTPVAADAITDLAVMNMSGGYSFTDYQALMDKYRDSQVRPFIDKFIATIKEYRENYYSEIPGNKSKADFAYSVLSQILEDDTGSNMGDLLLNPTREELGLSDEAYKALSRKEKAKTVDLTTAIMQGNTQVVCLMEQMLAIAADTNEKTWLERLSELGPDGLMEQYALKGIRPAEAEKEMAAQYIDTAKKMLNGWVDLRTDLLEYDAEFKATGGETTGEAEKIDLSKDKEFEIPKIDKDREGRDPATMTADDAVASIGTISRMMEHGAKLAEETEGSDIAGIYYVLNALPYGEGTLYDFFTLEYNEVSGDNIAALYPLASVLTEGQAAAIDLLPLRSLMQIGATNGETFEEFSPENSNLYEGVDFVGGVSIYLNVNRELFSRSVAMTSDALRKGTTQNDSWMKPDSDLLGLSRLTVLSWAASGIFGVLTLASAAALSYIPAQLSQATIQYKEITDSINYFWNLAMRDMDDWDDFVDSVKVEVFRSGNPTHPNGIRFAYSEFYGNGAELTEAVNEAVMYRDSAVNYLADAADDTLSYVEQSVEEDITSWSWEFKSDYKFRQEYDDVIDLNNQFLHRERNLRAAQSIFSIAEVVFLALFVIITVVSIVLTIKDLCRYYNTEYTLIPKYIVDEADITTLDEDGNQWVTRNDTAYYTVAGTNRPETHEQYKALVNYADLNGDAGKEWLALYCGRKEGGSPILADSFKVVTGTTDIPKGYTQAIHMFGSDAAQNLTDSRYTYNDKLNGIYVYYKTAAPSAALTASNISGGVLALVGFGGVILGGVLGAVIAGNVKRKKEEPATA